MALTLALSILGATLGAWVGAEYVLHRMREHAPLHEMLHEQLQLSAEQQSRIAGVEREHAQRRAQLELEMRAANAELARAFKQQHTYTAQVQAAIDHFHRAMSALQRETMLHVFAMRAVLTPEQAERFDERVVASLTANPM